jgi:hypothetical protein
MNRRAMVRHVMLGALVTGLAPLTGAGVDAAGAGESPAALCQSMFGERGPVGGPVVGEGPSGDPMSTTIGWDPVDWSDGLSEIVTCVSVGGGAVPALTTSMPTPRNDGSRAIRLTLPPGAPGAVVCEQSVLVGAGDAAGRHRTTSPVCFKLRAGEPPLGAVGPVADGAAPPAPGAPAGPLTPAPKAPVKAAAPVPYPASTPPARAAFEAALGGTGVPVARPAVPAAPTPTATADPLPAWPPDPAPAARAGRSTAASPAAAQPAAGATAALARTGLDEHIPLAGAGGFLALGGAAIILGAPRRRRPARRSV